MAFYPTVRDETVMTLNVIVKNLEQDPAYLEREDCPYSDTVKAFFRAHVQGSASGEMTIDMFVGDEELLVLDTQIIQVLNNLESFGKSLTTADVTEKMAYFRTKTTLLEKLLTMRERVANLKEVHDFREIILGFMNEICTKDQITDLMHRLDGVLGTKETMNDLS